MAKKFIVKTNWDVKNTTFLTQKLYGHVNNGQIQFNTKVKKGSILLEIEITVLNVELDFFVNLLSDYIQEKIRKERSRGNELRPVTVMIDDKTFVMAGGNKKEFIF